jgi:xanthine dehydrogenase accessory factor
MANVWARIRETVERHGSAGLVSVIDSAGSVPRESGARLVVRPDGAFFGTIGGGRLEYEALAAARAVLAAGRGAAEFRDWPLGPNLGQCCGGMVRTLTETFDTRDLGTIRRFEETSRAAPFATQSRLDENGRIAREVVPQSMVEVPLMPTARAFDKRAFNEQFGEPTTPVLLFGAGHVGRAVVLALTPLPFGVRWIDSRPDQFPKFVPQNAVTVCTDAVDQELAEAPSDAMVVVMTHLHALDFDIATRALQRESFDYVGLIGSETKRARFIKQARQLGVSNRQLDRLVCPIGIPQLKGKEPAVIAAALAVQLLVVRERAIVTHDSPAIQSA